LIYYFSNGGCLLHNDIRQFGYVKLVRTDNLSEIFSQDNYGPEPLDKDFTLKKFIALFKINPPAGGQKIKPLLMDQSFLSGIGNIYAQEACWRAKILPTRQIKTLSETEIKNLYSCLIRILKAAIKAKGTSISDYLDIEGKQGGFSQQLKVYGCEDKPCPRCGQKIKKIILAGRGTNYCPYCQK
jgi:formamidopyrimidine-DNA glycosylase